MTRQMFAGLLAGTLVVTALAVSSARAHEADVPSTSSFLPIGDFVGRADLVFKGTVTGVEYRNSDSVPALDAEGRPVLDDDGTPALADGSDLPHTFVTYRIEKVYRGESPGNQVTLRFLGGLDDEPLVQTDRSGREVVGPNIFEVVFYPLFDVGDRDLLFVERNTDKPCPLVRCESTRFRMIDGEVYTDLGSEIVRAKEAGSSATAMALGRPRDLDPVLTHDYGPYPTNVIQKKTRSADEDDGTRSRAGFRIKGPQFSETEFDTFISSVIRESPTTTEAPRRVVSADVGQAFTARPLTVAAPPPGDDGAPEPQLRPSLDDLLPEEVADRSELEQREAEAISANGGEPVFP